MKKGFSNHAYISFISWGLMTLYLSIGFIPNLDAVDKIAPQWLAMSILNLLSLIFCLQTDLFFSPQFQEFLALTYP